MGLVGDLTSPLKKRYALPNNNVNKIIQPGFFDDPLERFPFVLNRCRIPELAFV